MGDTMVTLKYPNGEIKYFDGLQKIFPVNNSFAAGFAGDVELGLMYMDDLHEALSGLPDNSGWIPGYFMNRHYCRRAKYIYNNLKPEYFGRPIELIVMGISPLATDTIGGGGRPRTHGYILKSPNFEVIKMERNQFYSIGSGSTVGIYSEKLNNLNSDVYNGLMQMEVSHTDGYGIAVSDYIRSIVSDNPPEGGISKHFITAFVHRGEVKIRIRISRRIQEDGTLTKDDTPPIFQSWRDIKPHIQNQFGDISQAQCIA
jgi:hypothetical protein